jgi:hypothetical protein
MSDELDREWRDHGSKFALLWLGAMKNGTMIVVASTTQMARLGTGVRAPATAQHAFARPDRTGRLEAAKTWS